MSHFLIVRFLVIQEANITQFVHNIRDCNTNMTGCEGVHREQDPSFDALSETSHVAKGESGFKGPAPVTASSGFAWAKKQKEDSKSMVFYGPSMSSSQSSALDSSRFSFANASFDSNSEEKGRHNFPEATAKPVMLKQRRQFDSSDSLNASSVCHFNGSRTTEEADAVTSYLVITRRRRHEIYKVSLNNNVSKHSFVSFLVL